MNWDSVQQFIRLGMQMFAGYLVGQGYLTEDMGTQFVGGFVSLAGVAWWFYWENKRVK